MGGSLLQPSKETHWYKMNFEFDIKVIYFYKKKITIIYIYILNNHKISLFVFIVLKSYLKN